LKFGPLKPDGASRAENEGILTKATGGFEPPDGGFADLAKTPFNNTFSLCEIFLPHFYPSRFCDARRLQFKNKIDSYSSHK
jgi:hypothetical protein